MASTYLLYHRTGQNSTIPPETQIHINARVEASLFKRRPDSYVGVLPTFLGQRDPLPRSVTNVNEGHTVAAILNPTKTPIRVKEGCVLGRIYAATYMNAPPTFQRLMELVLCGLHWTACLVYLDDIIILGNTFKEHCNNISEVLSRFQSTGLTIKPKKCHFF